MMLRRPAQLLRHRDEFAYDVGTSYTNLQVISMRGRLSAVLRSVPSPETSPGFITKSRIQKSYIDVATEMRFPGISEYARMPDRERDV
jgi:hypothetical protein